MPDALRVLFWPVVVPRWWWGTDWCAVGRVLETVDALQRTGRIVDPSTLRSPVHGGVVVVFDHPTVAFLDRVAPVLLDRAIPFATCVTTAWVRTREARGGRPDAPAVTWAELRGLADAGVAIGVRAHDVVDVAGLPDELAFGQLATARLEVQRRLGVTPWLCGDPASPSRRGVVRMATELGFDAQVVRGVGRLPGGDARREAIVPKPWQTAGAIVARLGERRRARA